MNVLIVYGSTTGNTERVAELINENLAHDADVVEVSGVHLNDIKQADLVLFGSSTWGDGELQDDFDVFIKNLNDDLLVGKNVAVFGCGDEDSYPDAFCHATDIIREKAEECGANVIAENLRINGDPDDNLDLIEAFARQF